MTYDASAVASFIAKAACTQKFDTYQKFNNWATSANLGIPLAEGLLNIAGDATSNDSLFKSQYDAACSRLEQSGAQAFSSLEVQSIFAPQVYEAWNRCIEQFAGAQNAFASVVMQGEDATTFSVRLKFSQGTQFPVRVQSMTPGESLLKCVYNDVVPVKAGLEFPNEKIASFDCRKAPDQDLKADINTTAGSVTALRFPARIVPPTLEERVTRTEQDLSALRAQAATLTEQVVQPGTVVAVTSSGCPKGWHAYSQLEGRVVVGAGSGPDLSNRVVGQSGGSENVKLTIAQMPSHAHEVGYKQSASYSDHHRNQVLPADHPGRDGLFASTAVGGNKPHENMPPFFVMTMCEKL